MKIMEETDNAIFVSIHQNHYSSERYWGLQVFYSGNFSEYSQPMAEAIQETVSELLQPDNDRQIKECGTSVYLLYNAKKPAILVECGFLSNHKEAELLKTEEYQKTISCCIYMGLLEYLSGGQRNGKK
jgi:N-acetylmuramoyl-L-alanine amidase